MSDQVVLPSITEAPPSSKPYQPFGAARDVLYFKGDEAMLDGPAGTGKSRGLLEKVHIALTKYPNARGLMVRKTRESLTQSAMVTYEKFVVPENGAVRFRTQEQEYRYSNGSVLVVGGMDKASKVMSADYDIIYAQEATELTEEDWESLTTRARNGIMPYNQVIGDCNPNKPQHWLKKRMDGGLCHRFKSVHKDNPTLFDHVANDWTPRGLSYMSKLMNLSGVRRKRLYEGIWAAAEGMIYTEWDPEIHIVKKHFDPPKEWRRVWVTDFGFTNPFVWQAWAIDGDNNAYRFAEIYYTQLLVEDACSLIRAWQAENSEPKPEAYLCDWDAEDRHTIERHLEVPTTAADKDVSTGIEAMKSRLRHDDGHRASMYFMPDSLLETDPDLLDAGKPTCTEQEVDGYEWDNAKTKEVPIKIDDHGMDCSRYFAKYTVGDAGAWSRGMRG